MSFIRILYLSLCMLTNKCFIQTQIWEQCAPDFKTDAEGVPNYKGDPFNIPGKGICTTDGVKNGIVR